MSINAAITKIKHLSNLQVAIIITIIGFAVYTIGLFGQFQGDDFAQIVNNPVVHSVTHIKYLFEGSTFYNGQGLAPLSGTYYRPLMTTIFSVIYTLFGPHAFYFHLVQLLIVIGSAIILYLFFRYSLEPAMALFLAIIFLVHPINSQNVFAIPSMQDALFFFFGILGMWILVRFSSIKSLFLVAGCLLLSLLSKESGILFVIMSCLYLIVWDRRRFIKFTGILLIPLAIYMLLRVNAVGLLTKSYNAPIDNIGLGDRLLTDPSILLFYVDKLVFPWRLASAYYWVDKSFTLRHFLVPLVTDLAVIGLFIYGGVLVNKKANKATAYTYLFFGAWCLIGLVSILQIIPLDMTATNAWFYFAFVGLLGMIGVFFKAYPLRFKTSCLLVFCLIIISLLGIRSALWGLDWQNQYKLSYSDISSSPADFGAYNLIAYDLMTEGKFNQAILYSDRSLRIMPNWATYNNLGLIYMGLQEYPKAKVAYDYALKYENSDITYDNLAELTLVNGTTFSGERFIEGALKRYPNDANLWLYLSILEFRNGELSSARSSISRAYRYDKSSAIDFAYTKIMDNVPFSISIGGGST